MPHQARAPQSIADALLSRRALLLGLTAALVATQVSACGDGGTKPPDLLTAHDVARVVPAADSPVPDATGGMVAFGHALCQAAASPGANWVASPLSIATAFAMARAGAGGTTASQLDKVFGFPTAGRDAAFNAITRQLVTTAVPPRHTNATRDPDSKPAAPIVSLGNALFTSRSLKIGADFLRTLAQQYGAGARPVDFTSGDALAQIDAWVTQQTAGRITKVFDQLDPTTLLVLANTVYLKADWAANFAENPATDAPFTRTDGSTVTASMMGQVGDFRYAARDGWQALELPYAKGDLAMWIMLPAPGRSPDDLLAPAAIGKVASALQSERLTVTVPHWDFTSDLDLGSTLQNMGLTAPFGADADFSGIAPGLSIGQAVHRANITVDEWGTEAAAVTGLAFAMSAPMPPALTFTADRPFAFAIVGGPTHVPLFIGHVADPTAR